MVIKKTVTAQNTKSSNETKNRTPEDEEYSATISNQIGFLFCNLEDVSELDPVEILRGIK